MDEKVKVSARKNILKKLEVFSKSNKIFLE